MTIDTKVNCGSCIAKIKDDMNQLLGKGNWSVDTTLPNKPMTFSDQVDVEEVLELLDEFNMKA
jgi:copper chaperone CopZ